MTIKYNVKKNDFNTVISYEQDGVFYSFTDEDPANTDYQRYLAWLENPEAEQSTPNLAD
jgi:hypothetical protein